MIAPLTAVLLSIGLIPIFVMSIYYPSMMSSMMLLIWNAQAVTTVGLAYHVSTFDQAFVMSKDSRGEVL